MDLLGRRSVYVRSGPAVVRIPAEVALKQELSRPKDSGGHGEKTIPFHVSLRKDKILY